MLKTTILVASFLGAVAAAPGAVAVAPPVPEHAVCDTFRDGASVEDIGKPVCWRATDTTAHAENGYRTSLGVCQKPNLPRNVEHLSIEAIESRYVPIAMEPVCPADMRLVYADVPLRDTPQCYCGVYRQPEIDSLAAIQQAYGEGGRMMCVKVELVDDVPTRSCYATHPDYPLFGDRDGGGLNYGGCRSDMHRCLHSNTLRADDPRRGFLNTVERIQKEAEEEKAAHSLELLELNHKLEKLRDRVASNEADVASNAAKANQLWAVQTVPNLWILDTDGSVKTGKYVEAEGLTLHQCREKCADGNARGIDGAWPYCVGFSRYQAFVDPVPDKGPDVPASCWWVTRYSHFEETDNAPGAGTISNEYTFRIDAFDVDHDGSVAGDYYKANGLTLAECQAKCADGDDWVGDDPWVDCAGFSRYSFASGGDEGVEACWWVKRYEDILPTDPTRPANENTFRIRPRPLPRLPVLTLLT